MFIGSADDKRDKTIYPASRTHRRTILCALAILASARGFFRLTATLVKSFLGKCTVEFVATLLAATLLNVLVG